MNALDPEALGLLNDAFQDVNADNDVRAIILTGAGTTAFCTGSDLKKTMPSDDGFVFSLEKRITNVAISAFNHDKKPAFVDRQRGGK